MKKTITPSSITGTNVLKIKATDREGDPITYELGADSKGRFKIHSITGQITANEVLDREVWINIYWILQHALTYLMVYCYLLPCY